MQEARNLYGFPLCFWCAYSQKFHISQTHNSLKVNTTKHVQSIYQKKNLKKEKENMQSSAIQLFPFQVHNDKSVIRMSEKFFGNYMVT